MLTVEAGQVGAAITANVAAISGVAISGLSFSRGITNVIAISITSTLEGVVQPDPMSNLVSEGLSSVVGSFRTPGKSRVADDNPIVQGVRVVVCREGGVAEKAPGTIGVETDGVDVESAGISLSKSFLHSELLGGLRGGVVKPVCVQCPNGVSQLEAKTNTGKGLVQNVHLFFDLIISGMDNGNKGKAGQEGGRKTNET